MRRVVWLVMLVLAASLAMPSAQAGPLDGILGKLPEDLPNNIPNNLPEDLPEQNVPTNGGLVAESLEAVKNEIGRIAGNPEQGPAEQVAQTLEVLAEWAKRLAENGGCVPEFDMEQGSEPVVPPRITTSEAGDSTTTTIDAGAVTLEVTTRDNCLGSPQSQSWPGGGG